MRSHTFNLLLTLSTIIPFVPALYEDCPNPEIYKICSCSMKSTGTLSLSCYGKTDDEIRAMMEKIPKGVVIDTFQFFSNNSEYIKKRFFGNATVQYAFFYLPNLRMIHDEAFQGQQHSLKLLTFSKADIARIPSKVVTSLEELIYFVFRKSTKVQIVEKDGFKSQNVLSLVELDLNFNSISILEDEAFAHLPKLQILSLIGNKLKIVNPHCVPRSMPYFWLFTLV